MKKICFIAIVLFFSCSTLTAQEFTFSIGYGSYEMGDLKAEMRSLQTEYPIQPKIVENFPAYLFYSFSFAVPVNRILSLGAFYTLMSTGGRMSYQDQTGSILVDMPITGHQFGFINRFKLSRGEGDSKFAVTFFAREGIVFSKMEALERITIGNSISTQSPVLTSRNLTLDIGVDVRRYFNKNFYVSAAIGAHVTVQAHNLEDEGGEYDMKADWGGGRLSIGVGFSINKPDKE